MNKALLLAGVLWTAGLAGCATMPPEGLTPVEVGTGQTEEYDPANTILYFPAGKPLPFFITAGGSVFEEPVNRTETFVLKRDIYTWRDMVSFDGKHWQPKSEVLTGEVRFNFNPKNVRFSFIADFKKK